MTSVTNIKDHKKYRKSTAKTFGAICVEFNVRVESLVNESGQKKYHWIVGKGRAKARSLDPYASFSNATKGAVNFLSKNMV
jgi:hypothetical protein